MTFSVETGLGTDPTANSYASEAEFRAYWDDRGVDTSTFSSVQVQVSLVVATTYLERYRYCWFGYELVTGDTPQPLGWPRQCVYLGCNLLPALPYQVKRAAIEYAKRELFSVPVQRDTVAADASNQLVQELTKTVGPITKTTKYVQGAPRITQSFPSAEQWLIGLKADYSGDAIR